MAENISDKTKTKKKSELKKITKPPEDTKQKDTTKTKAAPKQGKSKIKVKEKVKKVRLQKKTQKIQRPAEKKIKVKKTRVMIEKPKKIPKKKELVFISGTKEVNLYMVSGKSSKKITLPIAFDEIYRLDLIRRAVKATHANRRQPYGPSPDSGMKHSTSTWGKGRGVARVQRQVQGRRAVESPNNVGGRRAHPPRVEKVWNEKINKKERWKARRVALAAISDSELVKERGHRFDDKITLPIIVEDEFEKIVKTKKALEIFQKIGIYDDIIRAINGKHIRSGKGKSRGRIYKRPKSLLIIAKDHTQIRRSVGNLIGVDVVTPGSLSIEDLAPGGDPGRLTIITESALKEMGSW